MSLCVICHSSSSVRRSEGVLFTTPTFSSCSYWGNNKLGIRRKLLATYEVLPHEKDG